MLQSIKVTDLIESKANVRKSYTESGIKEMKANILSHGLLQNLVVCKNGDSYEVIAGGRRLVALRELVKEGALKKDHAVECQVRDLKSHAEISLAENVVREEMNPADEYEAFAALLNAGSKPHDVALRFGCTVKHVEQRMRLGKVHPEIVRAYREGKMDLEDLQAFTLCDDQKKQLSVFKSLKGYQRHPSSIKSALLDKSIQSDRGEAKYVGREAYIKAGGQVEADLFSKDEWFLDGALLDKLFKVKLDTKVEALKKEGYDFVEVAKKLDESGWDFRSKFEELDKAPKANKDKCGIYIYVTHFGQLDITYLKKKGKESANALTKAAGKAVKKESGLSQALSDDLAAYRMEIIQTELMLAPSVALDMLTFQVAEKLARDSYYGSDSFGDVSFKPNSPTGMVTNEKTTAKAKRKEYAAKLDLGWMKHRTEAERFTAFCKIPYEAKCNLLTAAFARTINSRLNDKRAKDSAYEAAMTQLNPQFHLFWRPTKENYLGRITIDMLDAIGKEVFGKVWKPAAMNKAYLVTQLDAAFKDPKKASGGDTGLQIALETWLPIEMRVSPLQAPLNAKLSKTA